VKRIFLLLNAAFVMADQHLSYYSVLKKTVKWSKKLVLYLLNCVLFNAFFVYGTLNTNKVKYKNFLPEL